MNISGIWDGTLDGTNWGQLLVKLTEKDGFVWGFAEFDDVGVGKYNLTDNGSRRDGKVVLNLEPGPNNVRAYPGTIDAHVTSDTPNLIRGEWRSSVGTSGTFRASRSEPAEPSLEEVTKRIAEANAAFVIMAFTGQRAGCLPVVDILAALKRGCESAGIRAHRVDEVEHSGSITSLLLQQIRLHRFLVSDLTHERPNVYYEDGFAHGLGKEVIMTAQKGTQVHFDIAAYNVIFYESVTELEERVKKRILSRIQNA
jgi:hypothetical protein